MSNANYRTSVVSSVNDSVVGSLTINGVTLEVGVRVLVTGGGWNHDVTMNYQSVDRDVAKLAVQVLTMVKDYGYRHLANNLGDMTFQLASDNNDVWDLWWHATETTVAPAVSLRQRPYMEIGDSIEALSHALSAEQPAANVEDAQEVEAKVLPILLALHKIVAVTG